MIAQNYAPYLISGLLLALMGLIIGQQQKLKKQRVPIRIRKENENSKK